MTRREEMFMALGKIDDNLIMRSETYTKKKMNHKFMWYGGVMASAACLLLVFNMMQGVRQPGGTNLPTPTQNSADNQGGGYGPDHPNDYVPGGTEHLEEKEPEQAYGMAADLEWVDFNAGPIMPLTFATENASIVADRELTYDFSEVSKADKGYVSVKDSYVLNNTSSREQTITFYYPYVSDIKELATHMPGVAVNKQLEKTAIMNGPYMGMDSAEMMRIFASYVSADEYNTMLSDVKPLDEALNMDLLQQKVIAYEFTEFDAGTVPGETATYAASIKATGLDKVYTAHMMDDMDAEAGTMSFYFMFEQAEAEGQKPAIYFLGEEPAEYKEQGYIYLELSDGNASDEVTARMNRRETTMQEILEEMVEEKLQSILGDDYEKSVEMKALFYHRAAKMFCDMYQWNTDGCETAEDAVFYANSLSDIMHYVLEEESVYLLTDTITIPAGGSVTVDFAYLKQGSCQNYEPQEALRDNYCYDNMPSLGTNVEYKQLTATIVEDGNIRIESQNYGFDLEGGIRQVEMEPDAERYYMIVKFLK